MVAIDLSANENPLGASPRALEAAARHLGDIHRYPDDAAAKLKGALAAKLGVGSQNLILGNGSSQILDLCAQASLREGDEAVLADPAFLRYRSVVEHRHGTKVLVPLKDYCHDLDAMADRITDRTRLVFLGNPNNPTGTIIRHNELSRFLLRVPPDVLVVLDEAYKEYVQNCDFPSSLDYLAQERRVLVTRSFSKAYGLAGLRIGYGIGSPAVIQALETVRPRYNTNRLAQVVALAALADDEHLRLTVTSNAQGRAYLAEQFGRLGLFYVPSEANFFLLRVGDGRNAHRLLRDLGLLVQPMDRYGLPAFVRVSVGLPEENERLISVLGARSVPGSGQWPSQVT